MFADKGEDARRWVSAQIGAPSPPVPRGPGGFQDCWAEPSRLGSAHLLEIGFLTRFFWGPGSYENILPCTMGPSAEAGRLGIVPAATGGVCLPAARRRGPAVPQRGGPGDHQALDDDDQRSSGAPSAQVAFQRWASIISLTPAATRWGPSIRRQPGLREVRDLFHRGTRW